MPSEIRSRLPCLKRALWFVCNRSLFLAAVCDEWALPPDQNSLVPVVFDSIVLKKNHWKLSELGHLLVKRRSRIDDGTLFKVEKK